MRVIISVAAMQRLARTWRSAARKVAFVPTMGYLHAGHASLMERARKLCGPKGIVVVSIYVNPTQFAPNEDFSKYPRDFKRDASLCRKAGVDVIFAPETAEIYPPDYSVYVVEERLGKVMEGASRPTHFRGVTTVVAKLFNIVLPTVAVFGAKDFQQAAIIQRMGRDLNFPVQIVVAPTIREDDGLALSSRNKYLSAEERKQAPILYLAVQTAGAAVNCNEEVMSFEQRRVGKRNSNEIGIPSAHLKKKIEKLIKTQSLAKLDYVEFFDPATLEPAKVAKAGTRMALAVRFGATRLIDNAEL